MNEQSPTPAAGKAAVVLLSGGLDSATVLAEARHRGYRCYALSFDYGQRHRRELDSAAHTARALGAVEHRTLRVDLGAFGGSALTDNHLAMPHHANAAAIDRDTVIPITYVPARNTVFLACALGWAEVLESDDLFIGANALDYSGYPDCRPEYLEAFERMANLATARGVSGVGTFRIHAPLLHLTKAQTIQRGVELGLDYSLTHSCYDPTRDGRACGRCDSCLLRLRGFADAGLVDPVRYVEGQP